VEKKESKSTQVEKQPNEQIDNQIARLDGKIESDTLTAETKAELLNQKTEVSL
jgi:hypothetical protein